MAMQRYFFDIYDGEGLRRDEKGRELAHPDKVPDEAMAVLSRLASDANARSNGRGRIDLGTDVRNEQGDVVYTATLSLVARWAS